MYQNQAHRGTDGQVMRWVEKQGASWGFQIKEETEKRMR